MKGLHGSPNAMRVFRTIQHCSARKAGQSDKQAGDSSVAYVGRLDCAIATAGGPFSFLQHTELSSAAPAIFSRHEATEVMGDGLERPGGIALVDNRRDFLAGRTSDSQT